MSKKDDFNKLFHIDSSCKHWFLYSTERYSSAGDFQNFGDGVKWITITLFRIFDDMENNFGS